MDYDEGSPLKSTSFIFMRIQVLCECMKVVLKYILYNVY
jgi:hypothetical protein